MVKVSEKEAITNEVIKNLLSAHRRIAENGDPKQTITLSKYLLKLAEKRKDKLLDLGAKEND